jgi:hypothetical protein
VTYNLKWAEETAWAVIVAGMTYIVGVAAAGMPTDHWQVWAVTLAAGSWRVVFATLISRLGSTTPTYTTEPSPLLGISPFMEARLATLPRPASQPATNSQVAPVATTPTVLPDGWTPAPPTSTGPGV